MDRAELRELHYITCWESVPSILEHGLLSHQLAARVDHESIADEEIQGRRAAKAIGRRSLHSYVNLYFWARNAMLIRCYRYEGRRNLVVLSISKQVLDLPGVIVADQNMATDWVRYHFAATGGLEIVDPELTFAESWDHPNPYEKARRRAACQAEVLVPDRVDPEYVKGAYLPGRDACARFHRQFAELRLRPWPRLFFLGDGGRGEEYSE
jgi:hypothetical protein